MNSLGGHKNCMKPHLHVLHLNFKVEMLSAVNQQVFIESLIPAKKSGRLWENSETKKTHWYLLTKS